MLGLALVVVLDAPVGLAALVVALSSTAATPYFPAVGALTPTLVGEDDLAAANALTGVVDNIAIAIGPALGGLVLAIGGSPEVAFAANAFTFLLSGVLVWRIRIETKPSSTEIGRWLYEQFEAPARERGWLALKALTPSVNSDSVAFHRRLGFALLGDPHEHDVPVVLDYFGPGLPRVVFWKPLTSG